MAALSVDESTEDIMAEAMAARPRMDANGDVR